MRIGRTAAAFLIVAAAAVVWTAASELSWPARAMTTFLVGVLPAPMLAQGALAGERPESVPRMALYLSSAAMIWVLAALAWAAAAASGFTRGLLGLVWPGPAAFVAWTLAATLAALALAWAGRRLGLRESPILRHLVPRTGREKAGFVVLSLSAGFGEELVFRSFLIPALAAATGSIALAVIVSSALFGLIHAYQRTAGAVRAGLLGAMLAVPMLATGSVLPSMAAHALYDVLAGVWLADRLIGPD